MNAYSIWHSLGWHTILRGVLAMVILKNGKTWPIYAIPLLIFLGPIVLLCPQTSLVAITMPTNFNMHCNILKLH